MGQYLFRLPDIGEGVAEAEIVVWHIKPGDMVREDQPLLDVMTDKATVDMTSPVEGRVVALHGDVGSMAPVGSVLIEMDVEGSAPAEAAPAKPVEQDVAQNARAGEGKPAPVAVPVAPAAPVNPDPTASPATRRRAMEWGIKLEDVVGSGPHGRILVEDLERHRDGAAAAPVLAKKSGVEEIKLTGLRRRIAEKMQDSKRHIPHFTYVEEFDLTELESLRGDLNHHGKGSDKPKLTLLPFFMRAVVKLVPHFPGVNAHYDEDAGLLRRYQAVHIGIAAQTPAGLMVPVVRHAEARDLWDCARELARVTDAARKGSATREELSGSTITLTSLGALGGIAATPIINHPETAIIGPNKLTERPVIDGAFITKRKLMNLSASFDHRIVDGHDAARFIQELKRLMEHPH